MKTKTTRKYVNAVYGPNVFSVGYCGAQNLLYGVDPFGYNAGVYGWNCDYYYVDGVCICTGYRPHGISTIGKTAEFEKQAEAIRNNWNMGYDEKLKKIAEIRSSWINALLGND